MSSSVKEKKYFGVVVFWLMMAALFWLQIPGMCVEASAAGSVELTFSEDAAGVSMTLYPIAVYTEDQSFQYQGVFEGCEVSLTGLENAEQAQHAAEQLAVLARDKGAVGVTKKVGTDGRLRYEELAPAYYLLVQSDSEDQIVIQKTLIPIPYTDENGGLVYDASVSPKYSIPRGAVILHKVDDENRAVGQARFVLQNKVYVSDGGELPADAETGQDGGGRFFWETYKKDLTTDEYGQIALSSLPLGIYRFVETDAPEGYILNDAPEYFSIEKDGEIKELNGIYQASSGQVEELSVVNTQTSLLVNKVDEQGNPVSGARLVIKDAEGKGIVDENGAAKYVIVTSEQPASIKRLPAGDYYLCEVVSPDGYTVAEDVPFTISDEKGAVNTVTMVDKKEKKTEVSLKVTKTLTDTSGLDLASEDQDFYVALFEDEERTKRISDVKTLHFSNSSSTTVEFENLKEDVPYYVGETDEFGVLLTSAVLGDAVYAPDYPDGYKVELKGQSDHELTFANEFYDLPRGFYYEGVLQITKKVLKNGEPYDTDEVFYAALFTDPAFTQRADNDVIKLAMGGTSELQVEVPVYIGETQDSSVTYYVTETDESGRPLDASSGVKFTMSVDKTEVTLTPQSSTGKVVITNTYVEEEETGEESESEEEEESDTEKPGTPGHSGSSGSSTVKTGDDTPILLYVVLLVLSAVLVAGLLLAKRRKRDS